MDYNNLFYRIKTRQELRHYVPDYLLHEAADALVALGHFSSHDNAFQELVVVNGAYVKLLYHPRHPAPNGGPVKLFKIECIDDTPYQVTQYAVLAHDADEARAKLAAWHRRAYDERRADEATSYTRQIENIKELQARGFDVAMGQGPYSEYEPLKIDSVRESPDGVSDFSTTANKEAAVLYVVLRHPHHSHEHFGHVVVADSVDEAFTKFLDYDRKQYDAHKIDLPYEPPSIILVAEAQGDVIDPAIYGPYFKE